MSRTRSGRRRIIAFTVSLLMLPAAWLGSSAATAATPTPPAGQETTASHAHPTAAAAKPAADSGPAEHHDTSPTLLSMVAAQAAKGVNSPNKGRAQTREVPDGAKDLPHPPPVHVRDPAVQSAPGADAAVAAGTSFDGIGGTNTGNSAQTVFSPPAPNAAVGTTQITEVVNAAFAVYSKTGTEQIAPMDAKVIWSGFGGNCESFHGLWPTVRWDSLAHRWVISVVAGGAASGGPFFECVAVSTTPDATGSYNRYVFQYSAFANLQKLSVWRDAYYVTYDTFPTTTGSFQGAEVCALDRARMLSGDAATQQCFPTNTTSVRGLLGADLDGPTAPPAGEPETVVALDQTTLSYWKFHVDWTTPSNSTFTGPTVVNVDPFDPACGSPQGVCVQQPGTTQLLETRSDIVMYRLAYRNFGDHESLVVNHAVNANSTIGIRWYELRMSGGNPTVFQQGTYGPADNLFRWMGSVAMDKVGNIGMGYSVSSSALPPSIRVTGRLAGDPAGTMTQGETNIITGPASQTTSQRWGPSSMAVDPADNCTFWYTNEYVSAVGSFSWKTRIAAFKLPDCV